MNTKKLQVVMPMAGAGSRFAKEGFKLPKPLIPVDGIPMFQKALTSLAGIKCEKSYLFIIRREHAEDQKLDKLIKKQLPEANIIIIEKMTRGAAETVLAAEKDLDKESPLIAMDCDLWFNSKGYDEMVTKSLEGNSGVDAGLLTFQSEDPRYSYAEIDKNGQVLRTAEKHVISPNAITGAYFFATATQFIDATKELMLQPISDAVPEYYISYVYNLIIAGGGKVCANDVDQFDSFGTPEELKEYENRQTK